MRILVMGPGHPFRGGIALTTTELVSALRGRGHDVAFLTPLRQYPRWLFPGGDDRDPDACPLLAGSRSILDPMAPWSWPAVRTAAMDAAAAVWIMPYWTWAWAGLWRFLLAGRRRPKAVAVVHNPADHDAGPVRRVVARSVLGRCQALFTHAERLADQLRSSHPSTPISAHPIPPPEVKRPCDRVEARHRLGLPADRRIALFVGLIRPYKGVDLLIEAFAKIPDSQGWHLVVAGEPWGRSADELRHLVAKLNVEKPVRLDLRWIPEEEMALLMAAVDVVVLPYRSGSQSAMAPIALASGVPVVASAVGGLPEIIQHEVNGLLVTPGSVDDLVGAFSELDEGRLAELATGARAWRGTITWDSYAAKLEALLERVTKSE